MKGGRRIYIMRYLLQVLYLFYKFCYYLIVYLVYWLKLVFLGYK